MANKKLKFELLELSNQLQHDSDIGMDMKIVPNLECSNSEVSVPYTFSAESFGPASFPFTDEYGNRVLLNFSKESIIANMNSIFKKVGNRANNELNLDHKNNRKMNGLTGDATMRDLVGKVTNIYYDEERDKLISECVTTDLQTAINIHYRTYKFVSHSIKPIETKEKEDGSYDVTVFDFEELSIVRDPRWAPARIKPKMSKGRGISQ